MSKSYVVDCDGSSGAGKLKQECTKWTFWVLEELQVSFVKSNGTENPKSASQSL